MQGKKKQILALALTLVLIFSASGVRASATEAELGAMARIDASYEPDGRVYHSLRGISNRNIWSYDRLSVTVGGKRLSVSGFEAGGVLYIPYRAAAAAISGSKYSYNSYTKTSTMRASGLEMTATDNCYVTYANGRTLFSTTPNVIMSDGRMYIPANVFAKAVGMSVSYSSTGIRLSGSYSPLESGDKFYRADEVFWLARIIHAESRGESLLGQIAVGNVVMNRVRSSYYPNTIYGVIFDRNNGVQFSPISNGAIYNTPGYSATLAAKICLEGYDVTGGAFFFLNISLATSSWIPRNRPYAFTIGRHDFYY